MIGGFYGVGYGLPMNPAEREGWQPSTGSVGSEDEAASAEAWVEQSSTAEVWTWSA